MWGPASAPGDIDHTFTLLNVSWNESGSAGSVVDVAGFDFGARIRGATNGLLSASSRLRIDETGAVGVRYPVRIELRIPEPNSFADGEEIAIQSSWMLQSGWLFTTAPAAGSLTFSAGFGLGASAGLDVCIFGCTTFNFFPPINIPNTNFDLLRLSTDGGFSVPLIPGANLDLLPHTFSFIESEVSGVSGTVDLPRMPNTSASVLGDGRTLRAAGSHPFVDISLDLDSYLNKAGFPIPLGQQTPNIGGAQAGYNILDVSMPIRFTTDQTFTFTPTVEIEATFPVAVPYRVTDAGGAPVSSGTASQITFLVGHTLHITFPAGQKTPMPSTPEYALDNAFSSATGMTFGAGFVETVGTLDITVPSFEVIPAITVDLCEIATLGLEHCPVTTPAVRSPAIDVHLGPLFQASQALPSLGVPLFSGNWTLGGFSPMSFGAFDLDPENPIILASTDVVSGLASGTGGAGTLTQTITLQNGGDVRLDAIQAGDAVTGNGFGVGALTSGAFAVNAGFNGVADPNTLAGGDMLPVGGSGPVTANFSVEPGNLYTFGVTGTGTSPIGTGVSASASASFAVYLFDIRPTPNNPRANGVLPAVLLSNENLDARDVDPASVRLDGVAPLRWDYQVRDAFVDLVLKFDRQAITQAIQARLASTAAAATTSVQVPVALPDADAVAGAILGRADALGEADGRTADLVGNQNGRLDVGDLRTLVLARRAQNGLPGGVALAPGAGGGGGGGGGITSVSGTQVTLPLTGMLQDGTPMGADDYVVVLSDGRLP